MIGFFKVEDENRRALEDALLDVNIRVNLNSDKPEWQNLSEFSRDYFSTGKGDQWLNFRTIKSLQPIFKTREEARKVSRVFPFKNTVVKLEDPITDYHNKPFKWGISPKPTKVNEI